jgi:hypothetical protein
MVILIAASIGAHAQEASRTVEQIYQFDERGDAKIEFDFQLGKKPWEQWKAVYGEHPDMLLRITKHEMAAAVIEDFALEKDDVHRRAVSRFTARALAQYSGNGHFEIPLSRDMKLVAGSGLEWDFTSSSLEGDGIVNVTYRGKLPAKAHDAHVVNGNDFNRLVYTLEVSPSKSKAPLVLGLLFLFGAGGLGALSFLIKETRATPPPLPT